MEQAVGERPVIGEEQESLGVEIETPNRIETSALWRKQIDDHRAPFRIAARADVATRLVDEHVVMRRGGRQRSTIDRDPISLWIGLCARLKAHLSVHADPTGDEERLSSAA